MAAAGWGGDRYAVFDADGRHALVWWTVWDDLRAADRFHEIVLEDIGNDRSNGMIRSVERLEVEGHPAVLYAYYPEGWDRATNLPRVTLN